MQTTFSSLEQDVVNWFVERLDEPILKRQLQSAILKRRDYTGVGLFLHLETRDPARLSDSDGDVSPIPGPEISSALLESGAGTVLFVTDGVADCLEIFAYGNSFPETLSEYQLHSNECSVRPNAVMEGRRTGLSDGRARNSRR
jgi:hypothetical protein